MRPDRPGPSCAAEEIGADRNTELHRRGSGVDVRHADAETAERWKRNLEKCKRDLSKASKKTADDIRRRMAKTMELANKTWLGR